MGAHVCNYMKKRDFLKHKSLIEVVDISGWMIFEACTKLVCVLRRALNAQKYMADVLEEHVVPYVSFVGDDFIFLHDNAHSAWIFGSTTTD
ncbi:hypothetical protein J6590_090409 [Homalodisca vitripennis]|nr:hypothetical protein J6590_090409 [Homalodisca vitripennis]